MGIKFRVLPTRMNAFLLNKTSLAFFTLERKSQSLGHIPGDYYLLMISPPGLGKTMLVKRLPTICI
jgi:hypothetical protein